jgi:hypothetical protein
MAVVTGVLVEGLVLAGAAGRLLAKTQLLEPGRQAGYGRSPKPSRGAFPIGEVVLPLGVVIVTDVGLVGHGHQAKYQPCWMDATTVFLFANANVTAETSLPA